MPDELLSVVREEFGRVAYSFKTHQKMIDRLNSQLSTQKWLNAALLTITAGGTIDVLIRDERLSKVVALIFSGLALFLAIFQLSANLDRLVDQHRVAARALWLLREEYIHLIADIKSGSVDQQQARKRRDRLTRRAARIYEVSPDTNDRAYEAARDAIKNKEELTFTPGEIDLLLPERLRDRQ